MSAAETLEQDDTKQTDHFEVRWSLFAGSPSVSYSDSWCFVEQNIQSTNWQTVRFKPPPLSGHIGWRVEFRSMEVSITDFENAAFTTFIALVSRLDIAAFHRRDSLHVSCWVQGDSVFRA